MVRHAEFAVTQPQVCYTAYTLGLKHQWTYYLRTVPDIEALLGPLEHAINHTLIPAITGHECAPGERDLLALPVRLGRRGLENPCRDLTPKQIYRQHETEKKRMFASRVLEVEHGTFTPLVFTTTGGMADECKRFHSRLAYCVKEGRRIQHDYILDPD